MLNFCPSILTPSISHNSVKMAKTTIPLSPWESFCYLGGGFLHSVVFGRKESYPQRAAALNSVTSDDFIVFLYTAVACFIVNWGLRKLVVERFAEWVMPGKPKKAKVEKVRTWENDWN